jgi:aryl-alcohol dehydrogenase-like predicted oxidoreductase
MKKIKLGLSDLEVSVLGLGCINFGTLIHEKTAFGLLDAYTDHTGNFIDTANNYAVWNGGTGDESEKTIGKWLRASNRRKDVVLATKIGALPKGNFGVGFSNMQGLCRKTIIEAVNKSLDNLQTEYIDLLYLHVDDFSTPQIETLSILTELVNKGLIKEIGCSNFWTWRVESARHICMQNGLKFFCAIQQRFSYLSPTVDADFFPQVAADKELESYINFYRDITMVAHTPLLYGQYNNPEISLEAYDTHTNRKKLNKLLKEEKQPVSWVLKYITEQFGGSVAISGTSKEQHLLENMAYFTE